MNGNSSILSKVLSGLAAVGLLVLLSYGVLRSQDYEPGVLSTGTLDVEVLDPEYDFTFSADPDVEILKYASAGGMSGVTTAYTLYGDGKLVFRRMGLFSKAVPVIETYEGNPVIGRYEAELNFNQMREMVDIPVTLGLLETSQKEILEEMDVVNWHTTDMGTQTLEVHLELYGRRGSNLDPVDFVVRFEDPDKAAKHSPEIRPLQAFTKLRTLMNLKLGFIRPDPTPED